MQSSSSAAGRTTKVVWIGRVLTAIPIGLMLFSAALKVHPSAQTIEFVQTHLGYSQAALAKLAVLEVTCVVLYAIPRTAFMGAIFLTGYLGGAVASHWRVGDMPVTQCLLIVIVWGGLYLRDERLRALLPLRQARPRSS